MMADSLDANDRQITRAVRHRAGSAEWRPYAENAHRADLPDGWYIFVYKIGNIWRWAVNAPVDPSQDPDDRYRQAEEEGRVGALEPGRTLRDAKKAAETAARGLLSPLTAPGDIHD